MNQLSPAPDEDDHRLEERISSRISASTSSRWAIRACGADPGLASDLRPAGGVGQLANVLGASKGSLSTMTRLLIQVGLIQRVGVPGRRRDYFRIKSSAWPQLIKVQMQSMTGLHQMVERGLAMLATARPSKVTPRNQPCVCKRRMICTPFWSASCRRCCNGGRRSVEVRRIREGLLGRMTNDE